MVKRHACALDGIYQRDDVQERTADVEYPTFMFRLFGMEAPLYAPSSLSLAFANHCLLIEDDNHASCPWETTRYYQRR